MRAATRSFAVLAILLLLASSADAGQHLAARSIRLDQSQGITLLRDGEPCLDIVLPAGSSRVTAFAARELRHFLTRSFGQEISLTEVPRPGRTAIILGDNSLSRRAGIAVADLPRDGFVIRSIGPDIHICGRDDPRADVEWASNQLSIWANYFERGTLNGVYDFLERFVGVRFYFPGEMGTIVPTHENLAVPGIDILERPDCTVRLFSWHKGEWFDKSPIWGRDGVRAKTLNMYRTRHETRYLPCNHGLLALNYHGRFADTHPEYFSIIDGKRTNHSRHPYLCFNSGVVEEIYQDVKAYLSGGSMASRNAVNQYGTREWDPSACQPGYVNIMPQDGFILCQCPKCRLIKDRPPVPGVPDREISDHIWEVTARIARRLQREQVPGHVTQMAYWPYNRVPDFPLPDNLDVMVGVKGPWDRLPGQSLSLVDAWCAKLDRKVWLWTYAGKFRGLQPGIPSSTPRAIGAFYARTFPRSFGAYMESDTDQYLFHYLNYYVFGKVMWDTRTDVGRLLDEHYRLMYGKAAGAMQRIFEQIEDDWLERIQGECIADADGVRFEPINDHVLWTRIYPGQKLRDMESQYAKAERLADTAIRKRRVRLMRQVFLGHLLERRRIFQADQRNASDWTITVPPKGRSVRAYLHDLARRRNVQDWVEIAKDETQLVFRADGLPPSGLEIHLGRQVHAFSQGRLAVPLASLQGDSVPFEILRRRNGRIVRRWNFFLPAAPQPPEAYGRLILDPASDRNIVRNEDITGKGEPWLGPAYAKEQAGACLDTGVFLAGGQSMRLESRGRGSVSMWQDLPLLKPDTPYRITFYLKLEDIVPHGAGGVVSTCFDQVNRYHPGSPLKGTIPWTKLCNEIITGPETNRKHLSYFNLTLRNASGKAWIDHVRITEITDRNHHAKRLE